MPDCVKWCRLFSFPTNEERRQLWTLHCRRIIPNFTPTKNHRLCEVKHFDEVTYWFVWYEFNMNCDYGRSESLTESGTTFHKSLRFVIFNVTAKVVLFVKVVFYYCWGGLLKLICRESGTPCHFYQHSQILDHWSPEHCHVSDYCNLWREAHFSITIFLIIQFY